ncbi:MAG: hypothetical protein PWP08_575 [Methanofollis sp.]|nr:hypothetical protein [Methanofollis sp.]
MAVDTHPETDFDRKTVKHYLSCKSRPERSGAVERHGSARPYSRHTIKHNIQTLIVLYPSTLIVLYPSTHRAPGQQAGGSSPEIARTPGPVFLAERVDDLN